MTATQVFQVELSNMAPEFLRSLQGKNDDVNAEKGHLFAPSSRVCDVLSTEPERNYDLLKSSPERCSWAKARTPFSDGNALNQELISGAEEALKLRRRNGRNFFSDGNILGDAIGGGAQAVQEVSDGPTKPTSWYPRPAFDNYKDWMRLFAPLRPVFFRGQWLPPQKPPPLKPVFLRQPQRSLDDWIADGDVVAEATLNVNRGWAKKGRLPSNAPSCLTNDDLNTEDITSGVQEDTGMLMPLLMESRVPDDRQRMVATESSSSDVNNSEAFGTSSCADNKDSSCTATSLSASEDVEDSARTSTTAASVAVPPRCLRHTASKLFENMNAEEPRNEPLAPLSSTGGAAVNWGTHRSTVSMTDEAEFDGTAPLFDFASAAPSEETIDVGGFNEVYPGTTKKTVAVRAMMPTIDEED